jgi:predicted O-methyltransferase YrrM
MTVYNDQVSEYITRLFSQEDEVQKKIFKAIPEKGLPAIMIKPEEGRFLQFLAQSANALLALEIGTLGGYSSIWIIRGLVKGGKLITLEKEQRHADVSLEHFKMAGVEDQVEIRVGEANQLLQGLSGHGPFDFIFIDADKAGYPAYYEWAMDNLRVGGIMAAHNALRKGSVAGTAPEDEFTSIMKDFNENVAKDKRGISTIYPAGDGMVISVKTS